MPSRRSSIAAAFAFATRQERRAPSHPNPSAFAWVPLIATCRTIKATSIAGMMRIRDNAGMSRSSSVHRYAHATFACAKFLLAIVMAWPMASLAQTHEFEVRVTPFNQIFPALDLSQGLRPRGALRADGDASVIGEGSGLVAVRLIAARDNENVQLDIDAAQESGIVEKFNGYADNDADRVLRQAWAIWHALDQRGIHYSGADPGIDRGPRVYSQRVRFLADTWADRSANCIDGSALLASALQRIGLRSFLVLVPGHAFVGFYTDSDAQHAAYLETTLLGRELPPLRELPAYAAGVSSSAHSASLAIFA